ncbi:AtpZ/AtpI family protein [Hyunsoonleella flava]|uniref:AtpZ/AtpI family protein n=1 Tax=Hyunsoonleella flava TaxID=2527939 RepID=A0A4Q9FEQ9_9FLAO|nr:AtpZ/AtpI family protein [Hyunsoonleella flava]TBN03898.1 AtpZ/AtpI family protein [Hyunsoonleella flava]
MSQQEKNQKKPGKQLRNWATFSGIGLQMAITIFLGNLLGIWLDKKLETSFLETTVTLVAIFASMFLIIYRVNRMDKDS